MNIKEFLSKFGSPLVLALSDFKDAEYKAYDFGKYHASDVLFELNSKNEFGLFFTPNGNYGDLQKRGTPIERKKRDPGPSPYYNALYIDIDLNRCKICKDLDELLEHINEVVKTYGLFPSYIIRSGGGYHMYWIIEPNDREGIADTYGDKVFEISKYMSGLFDGGDPNARGIYDVNGLARLPLSYHWKTGKPIRLEFVYESDITISGDAITTALQYIKDNNFIEKKQSDYRLKIGFEKYGKINEIPFSEVFLKLEKYPLIINGKSNVFRLEGNNIHIIRDGELIRTHGYRLNKRENYVNCFSSEYHDKDERPRGGIYPFLCTYFKGKELSAKEFIKNEFDLIVDEESDGTKEEIYNSFTKDDYNITFTNRKVFIVKNVKTSKGDTTLTKDLIKVPVKVIGKAYSNIGPDGMEISETRSVYIIEVKGETKILFRYPNKRKFNDMYCGTMFFYGEDEDLGMLYEAIDASNVEEIDIITNNGYYDGVAVLGGKAIEGKLNGKILTPLHKYELFKGEVITPSEYLEKLKEIYDDNICYPAMLEALAGAGYNLRMDNMVYPGMILTGETKCGKSSLSELLRIMLGYNRNSRRLSLPTTSPQPLKMAACDYSALGLEELTSLVPERTEEAVRNIINRDAGGRGFGTYNITYNFRSFLIITGERTMKDESLNNRLVNIIMSKKNWKQNGKQKVEDLKKYTCINHITNTYLNLRYDINEKKNGYSNYLAKKIDSRLSDVRSYMFVARDLFEIDIDNEYLFKIISYHLNGMGFLNEHDPDSPAKLRIMLCRLILQRKAQCIVESVPSGETTIYRFIFIDETIYEKLRGRFNMIISEINEHGERIDLNKDGINIIVRERGNEKVDVVLRKMMHFIYMSNRKYVEKIEF